MTIEEQAKELLDQVLVVFYAQDEWDQISLGEYIDEALSEYNEEVADQIYDSIGDQLSTDFTKTIPSVVPSDVKLSTLLYSNSALVAPQVTEILKDALDTQSTASDVARIIYDGYDSGVDVLDVMDELPDYITDFINDPTNADAVDAFVSNMQNLQTQPLKTATAGILDAISELDEDALAKALEVVLEEKARYYADRIAKTEIQRAFSLANAQDMLNDADIKLVKWQLSSRHKIFDICDMYANMDVGYGKGIYPKGQYPSIPLHPFCMCKVIPHYHNIKKKILKEDPMDKYLSSLSMHDQTSILGSRDKLNDWYNGDSPLDILNNARPKYPLVNVEDVLDDLKPTPLATNRVDSLQSDIDAQIAKHGSLDDLDYSMMDTSDRDLTRIQRLNTTLDQIAEDIDEVASGDSPIGFAPDLKEVLDYDNYADELLKYSNANPTINYTDETVDIFRSATDEIEAGDWIGLNYDYADGHNYDGLNDLYEMTVPITDIRWQGADFNEWIYLPEWIVKAYFDGLIKF